MRKLSPVFFSNGWILGTNDQLVNVSSRGFDDIDQQSKLTIGDSVDDVDIENDHHSASNFGPDQVNECCSSNGSILGIEVLPGVEVVSGLLEVLGFQQDESTLNL